MKRITDELYRDYLKKVISLIFEFEEPKVEEDIDEKWHKKRAFIEKFERKTGYEVREVYDDCVIAYKGGNYIFDLDGNLLSNQMFDKVDNFSEGFAYVFLRDEGYLQGAFINSKGEILNNAYFSKAKAFKNGYARVFIWGKGWNFINTKGELISDTFYDAVGDFSDGYAVVYIMGVGYSFIDTNGKPINLRYYDYADSFDSGVAKVRINGKCYYIDKTGKKICDGNTHFTDHLLDIHDPTNWVSAKMLTTDIGDYQLNKSFLGYQITNGVSSLNLRFKPIKVFNNRYILCVDDNQLVPLQKRRIYLYDRVTNKNEHLGILSDFDFDDNFIFDVKNKRVYLIYYNQKIEIPYDFYMDNIYDKKIKNVKQIKEYIYSQSEFFLEEHSTIEGLFKQLSEIERDRKKNAEQEEERKRIEQIKREKELAEEEQKKEIEALEAEMRYHQQALVEAAERLKKVGGKLEKLHNPIPNNFFIVVNDHVEINPYYIENELLTMFDYSTISFGDVIVNGISYPAKISGIDFRKCNINLEPQKVYQRDLRGCKFDGLHINAWMDFRDVHIEGASFTDDNDPRTLDGQNVYFSESYYNSKTTYNGKSFIDIFGECKKSPKKM